MKDKNTKFSRLFNEKPKIQMKLEIPLTKNKISGSVLVN